VSTAGGDFRGFLFGVVRNVAKRFARSHAMLDARGVAQGSVVDGLASAEAAASRVFDREWALALLRQAMQQFSREAAAHGDPQRTRSELLRLRFEEGQPIRAIAAAWECDPAWLHHEFAAARRDFKRTLGRILGVDASSDGARAEREIQRLWEALR
jgi:RNA polymerase sigma-70 factor (ECF subfamily)